MGLAEGLMQNKAGYSAGAVADLLERSRRLMPSDASKSMRSRFFLLRAFARMDRQDPQGALADFQTAFQLWPVRDNPALRPLVDFYLARDDQTALAELRERMGPLPR
jgi:hypothetical protein